MMKAQVQATRNQIAQLIQQELGEPEVVLNVFQGPDGFTASAIGRAKKISGAAIQNRVDKIVTKLRFAYVLVD